MKIIKIVPLLLILIFVFYGNTPEPPFQMITPSSEINERIIGKKIDETGLIRFEYEDGKIILDPTIPSEWTWVAGKNLNSNNGRIDFFFWNGLMFTNNTDVEYVNYRIRTFPKLFTDQIESNAFVIGFEKEDKGILFVATDEAKDIYVRMPEELMGREMIYNFRLEKNEAKMFRITRKTKPFLP